MIRAKAITEGAILIALYMILLLVSLYIPFISMITIFTLGLPFVIYTYRHSFKQAILFLFVALMITYLVAGIMFTPTTFVFGTAGMVIGFVSVKGKSAFSVLISGSLAFLVDFVLLYVASILFFQINIAEQVKKMLVQSISMAEKMMNATGGQLGSQVDQLYKLVDMLVYIIPFGLIFSAIVFALITQILANKVMKRLQAKIPTFPPFHDWRFPQSLLWYYLIVMVLTFFKFEEGSMLYVIVINAFLLLEMVMVIQGLILIFYVSHVKQWKKAIPVTITIFTLLIPVLLYIVRFLGIIDIGFDLRKRIRKK